MPSPAPSAEPVGNGNLKQIACSREETIESLSAKVSLPSLFCPPMISKHCMRISGLTCSLSSHEFSLSSDDALYCMLRIIMTQHKVPQLLESSGLHTRAEAAVYVHARWQNWKSS